MKSSKFQVPSSKPETAPAAAPVVGTWNLELGILACAACYGASDSPLAAGMNWGILSLLAIVGLVLGSVGTFFVFIAKKSAAAEAEQTPAPQPSPSQPSEPDPQAKP